MTDVSNHAEVISGTDEDEVLRTLERALDQLDEEPRAELRSVSWQQDGRTTSVLVVYRASASLNIGGRVFACGTR